MDKHKKGPHGDPDKGPAMKEGAHHFDKGYQSDEERFSPARPFEGDHERGNQYFKLQNEAVSRDTAKVKRSKFSKIA